MEFRQGQALLIRRAVEAERALERERATRKKLIDDEGRRDFVITYTDSCREVLSVLRTTR